MVLDGFGWFWVVLGGFGWFRVLVTTLDFLLMRPCSENSTLTKSFVIPVFLLFYFVVNKDKKSRKKKAL